MEETKTPLTPPEDEQKPEKDQKLSETWAQDALEDLEDFIESQGIYIRQ
ncbi:MAG: hypothetical protein Q4F41_01270 [Eubacteriales bacterium]|nr:hypothetical protein [Eubacteriales bacterium]